MHLREVAAAFQKIICGTGSEAAAFGDFFQRRLFQFRLKQLAGALDNFCDFIFGIKFQTKHAAGKA